VNASPNFIELDDHYELPRYGVAITRCSLDYELSLEFLQSEDHTIMTATEAIELDPECPHTLGPALDLLRRPVETVRAFKDGTLEMIFEDGRRLVSHAARYEAWHVYGHRGLRIVALPGGDHAIWRPE
jgi:hypothetical protein